MKVLLINQNPVIKKLVDVASKKLNLEVENLAIIPAGFSFKDFICIIVDDENVKKNLNNLMSLQNHIKVCLLFGRKSQVNKNDFNIAIQKPFLPTDILEILNQCLPKEGETNVFDVDSAIDLDVSSIEPPQAEDVSSLQSVDDEAQAIVDKESKEGDGLDVDLDSLDFSVLEDVDSESNPDTQTDENNANAVENNSNAPQSENDIQSTSADDTVESSTEDITVEDSNTKIDFSSDLSDLKPNTEDTSPLDLANFDLDALVDSSALKAAGMEKPLDLLESDSTLDEEALKNAEEVSDDLILSDDERGMLQPSPKQFLESQMQEESSIQEAEDLQSQEQSKQDIQNNDGVTSTPFDELNVTESIQDSDLHSNESQSLESITIPANEAETLNDKKEGDEIQVAEDTHKIDTATNHNMDNVDEKTNDVDSTQSNSLDTAFDDLSAALNAAFHDIDNLDTQQADNKTSEDSPLGEELAMSAPNEQAQSIEPNVTEDINTDLESYDKDNQEETLNEYSTAQPEAFDELVSADSSTQDNAIEDEMSISNSSDIAIDDILEVDNLETEDTIEATDLESTDDIFSEENSVDDASKYDATDIEDLALEDLATENLETQTETKDSQEVNELMEDISTEDLLQAEDVMLSENILKEDTSPTNSDIDAQDIAFADSQKSEPLIESDIVDFEDDNISIEHNKEDSILFDEEDMSVQESPTQQDELQLDNELLLQSDEEIQQDKEISSNESDTHEIDSLELQDVLEGNNEDDKPAEDSIKQESSLSDSDNLQINESGASKIFDEDTLDEVNNLLKDTGVSKEHIEDSAQDNALEDLALQQDKGTDDYQTISDVSSNQIDVTTPVTQDNASLDEESIEKLSESAVAKALGEQELVFGDDPINSERQETQDNELADLQFSEDEELLADKEEHNQEVLEQSNSDDSVSNASFVEDKIDEIDSIAQQESDDNHSESSNQESDVLDIEETNLDTREEEPTNAQTLNKEDLSVAINEMSPHSKYATTDIADVKQMDGNSFIDFLREAPKEKIQEILKGANISFTVHFEDSHK
ncbi:hypothetical protein CQA66_07245 [Helicobacter aurati]|uniref:Poly E-rich protein n=1 Tax=Helicobacter aurati TaxID=137778 RepID=A0A3D8J0I8_9HELI|nr:hypothetical protein [Helicobacter aurati]RDU71008.1 hypothetical protein CQA66_07245 [Helicobacter aurati]